jgi:Rieske Fe-S protein
MSDSQPPSQQSQWNQTRRTMLAVAGAGGIGIALTACGSGSGDKSVTGSGGSGYGGDSGGGGSAAAAPPSGAKLTALNDVGVGSSVSANDPEGKPVIVTRTGENSVVAFSAKCTHKGCTVAPAGKELDCPCHGSKFDAATGKVIHGPAQEPLPSVAVRVDGGNVVTGKG